MEVQCSVAPGLPQFNIVGLADKAGKSTREPFLFFVVVLLVYLAITAVSDKLLARAERWANTGQDLGRGGGGTRAPAREAAA